MRLSVLRSISCLLFTGLIVAGVQGRLFAQEDHEPTAGEHTHADGTTHAHDGHSHDEAGAEHHDEEAGATHDEHAGHGDIDYNKPPIDPNPAMLQLFIFSLVLFVGFVFVARQFVWKPLIAALDQREARVNHAYHEAETAKAEAARLLAAHDARMNLAQEEVKGIVAQARQQAEQEKAQIIAAAEAEAQALRDNAVADIRRARDEALQQLMATADRQADVAAEHVIGRPFSNN